MPLREFTSAELLVTERRRLELPLLALVWIASTAFSLAEWNLFYLLAASFGVGVNLLAVLAGKEIYLQRIFVNLAVVLSMAVLGLEFFSGRVSSTVALAHFMILIQLCKLFEQKRNRDYAQMLLLSLLVMICGAIVTQALWFVATMLLYVILLIYVGMVFTLKRGLDHTASARLTVESSPLQPQRVAWNVSRRWPQRSLIRRVIVVLVAALLTGLLMFIITPRMEGGGFGLYDQQKVGMSGFSDGVRLGDVSELYLSDAVVMRLEPLDERATRLAGGTLYLRGYSFDKYAHSQWTRSAAYQSTQGMRRIPTPPPVSGDRTARMRVAMVSELLPRIFTPYPTPSVDMLNSDGTNALQPTMLHTHAPRNSVVGTVRYEFATWTEPFTRDQRRYLRLFAHRSSMAMAIVPAATVWVPRKVQKLAETWCSDLLEARQTAEPAERSRLNLQIARRIAGRLRSEYSYTLDLSSADPDRDGLEDFLFHMRAGHCEYFASAMTAMCRSLGVRARLVTGFAVDGTSMEDGRLLVRQRDAHAWTEVFTRQRGWEIVDATPGSYRQAGQGGLSGASDIWQRIRFWWNDRIVGFDEFSREQVGEWVARQLWNLWGWLKAAARSIAESFSRLVIEGEVDAVLLWTVLALAVLAVLIEMSVARRSLRKRRQMQTLPTWKAWQKMPTFARLIRRLDKKGLAGTPEQTLRRRVETAADRAELPPERLEALVEVFYRLRWGGQNVPERELARAEDSAKQMLRQLRRQR
ncbi:MAG: DUF3488 and DUF4129 domain-containing transglutaminase family protein [Phycisphaerae bacterium]